MLESGVMPRRRRPRSCAATWSSSSSTASTWRRRGALQYARTLSPDDLRAVHFDIDTKAARELEQEWSRLGLARLPLDIIECPDRRLGRAAIELVADATLDGDTECTVLLPRPRVPPRLAALPPRPHGRQDRRRPRPGAPRQRHHRALRRGRPLRRAGALVRAVGAAGAPGRRRRPDGPAPVDPEGRTGVDRMGRPRDGPRRTGRRCSRPTRPLAQRAGATMPIAG